MAISLLDCIPHYFFLERKHAEALLPSNCLSRLFSFQQENVSQIGQVKPRRSPGHAELTRIGGSAPQVDGRGALQCPSLSGQNMARSFKTVQLAVTSFDRGSVVDWKYKAL
jgi:hypothetical protein